MKTREELIQRVIASLGEVFPGEQPTTTDIAIIEGYVEGKLEELARRRIIYIGDDGLFSEDTFLPLAKLIANAAGPEFGRPFTPDTDAREESRLRDINRGPSVHSPLATDYF